jgi:hypothetical protein
MFRLKNECLYFTGQCFGIGIVGFNLKERLFNSIEVYFQLIRLIHLIKSGLNVSIFAN